MNALFRSTPDTKILLYPLSVASPSAFGMWWKSTTWYRDTKTGIASAWTPQKESETIFVLEVPQTLFLRIVHSLDANTAGKQTLCVREVFRSNANQENKKSLAKRNPKEKPEKTERFLPTTSRYYATQKTTCSPETCT